MKGNKAILTELFYRYPEPVFIFDFNTQVILDANVVAERTYGYDSHQFRGMLFRDLMHEKEFERFHSASRILNPEAGTTDLGEFKFVNRDGQVLLMKVSGYIANADGNDAMIVFCREFDRSNDKNHKNNTLKDSTHHESTHESFGFWRFDIGRKLFVWSKEVFAIWGIDTSNAEVLLKDIIPTIHTEDLKEFEKKFKLKASDNKYTEVTYRIISGSKGYKWIHEKCRLIFDDENKPVALEGTIQDVSGHKEEELRLKLLESVVTNANDAIVITEASQLDEPGPRIIYVNNAFTRMTGYSSEEAVGRSPRFLQGSKTDRGTLRKLKESLARWEPSELTVLNYKKNGDEFWINMKMNPVADESGWFTHWIAIERDVTREKQEEMQKDLFAQIRRAFHEEKLMINALQKVCVILSEFGNLCFVEIWQPDIRFSRLQLNAHASGGSAGELFYQITSNYNTFGFNDGMPGAIWNSQKFTVWDLEETGSGFVRLEAARSAGIRAVMGIPLKHHERMKGVLLVGTSLNRNVLDLQKELFTQLITIIGSEINRKRLENQFEQIFNLAPDLIGLLDENGNFIKINHTGCRIMGYHEEIILNQPITRFTHPNDIEIVNEAIEKGKVSGGYFNFKCRFISNEGAVIWLTWSCNFQKEGRVIFSTAKDITGETKLMELLDDASRMALIGGWEVDLIHQKVYWSDAVHLMHGTDPATYEPDFDTAVNFYREDYRSVIRDSIIEMVEKGVPMDQEAILINLKGESIWVRVISKAEFVNGKAIRIYGSFQNINDRKITQLRLNEILGSISDAFYAVDSQWNFIFFNKEAERLLNTSSGEVLGKCIWEVFPAAKGTELESIYLDVTTTGITRSFEYFYPGNNCWYEVNAYPSENGLSVYFKNIDERKLAAVELKNAYDERNQILESIADAFFAVDNNWTVTYWNNIAEKVLLRKKDQIIGRNLWEVFPDAVDSDFYRKNHEAKRTGQTVTFEEYYPGNNKWFEVTAYPSEKGLSAYFRDTTTRKEMELMITEANERFEKVAEATNEAVWDWNLKEHTLYFGKGYNVMFGYHSERITPGLDVWTSHIAPADRDRVSASITRFIESDNESVWQEEYRYQKADGTFADIIDRGILVRDNNGNAVRMVGAMRDISFMKEYERNLELLNQNLIENVRKLEIANEELEQFAFITSHDLQEPLRMISSFLELLGKRYGNNLDDKAQQYIHYATDGARRMKTIILDLLEYSRAGRLEDSREHIDLNELLGDYKTLRRKSIEDKSVKIIHSDLPPVNSYRIPMLQVMHNLLDNAIKYSKPDTPPVIELTVNETASEWIFAVKDNGIGIEKEFYSRIFVIFQRLHNRSQFEGSGVGLAIVKKHIESMGGKIWVESVPGEGTTFHFTIKK